MKEAASKLVGFCAIGIGLISASLMPLPVLSVERDCDTEIHVDCGSTPNAVFAERNESEQPRLWVVFVQNN